MSKKVTSKSEAADRANIGNPLIKKTIGTRMARADGLNMAKLYPDKDPG
jgi:hypothetical protein